MRLDELDGIGKARLEALHAAGIVSLRDLLCTFPIRYVNMGECQTVASASVGGRVALRLRRMAEPKLVRYGKQCRVTCAFEDDTGMICAVWFNQPWMKTALMKYTTLLLFGLLERYAGKPQLMNPSIETTLRIQPIYRPIDGLPAKVRESAVKQALGEAATVCAETLDAAVRQKYQLVPRAEAVRVLHAPETMEQVESARRRLAFETMLGYQLAIRELRSARSHGYAMPLSAAQESAFWATMPFEPTAAQRRTLHEIADDLRKPVAMARMVQGDVGCGKTAIAFGAMALAAQAGYQAVLMAPTEILARQHMESAKELLPGLRCGLLLGGMSAAERREALEAIENGTWQIVLGTHALLSERVTFHRLGLCITDEQHRFGVEQRTRLLRKGAEEDCLPHLLVMSATPIPRSLALVLFGDLDVSVVDELPPGREPVKTRVVPEAKRDGLYAFLRKQVDAGRQAYIVCPLVEEAEEDEKRRAVESLVKELRAGALKGVPIGSAHGGHSAKADVLGAFARGELRALVATTVIEVGVNVPNATVMIVENADRYGLAQLHQLRGRVGRGGGESWCFLVAKENERLRAMVETNDGFAIARKDLELRGMGELLGKRQHGAPQVVDALAGDTRLWHEAQECLTWLEDDPAQANSLAYVRSLAQDFLRQQDVSIS